MKNIFHICPNYLQNPFYTNLFTELEKSNKNIVYVPFPSVLKNVPWKVEYLDMTFSLFDRLLYYRKQHAIYQDIINKNYLPKIQIIHAHTLFSAGYTAYLISKKTDVKYVVAIRDTDVNIFFKYMVHLRNVGLKIMLNAEQVIFLSETYKRLVLSRYVPESMKNFINMKSKVIPNGVDKYFLHNKYYRKMEVGKERLKILFIGSVEKRKNIITTIKACLYLQKKNIANSYTVVGEKKSKYLDWYLNKFPFITYSPKCNKERVLQYMRDAHIFVMPSITETFGLVYAEAMSQGLPVIYTKGQGFDGQFKDGEVGYAVNCFDHKMIAQKIIEIYSNYNSISERCTKYADRFDWEKIAAEYKEIYNDSYKTD